MSSAPAGQEETASARLAEGAASPSAGGLRRQPGSRWLSAVARYGPVLGPMAVMIVMGLWGLTRDNSMGNDEVATRWAALLSLRELAHLLRHVDAVHGLYYLIMHCWAVVGSSPTALRVPSVISMTIGAGLLAMIGKRLTGSGWAGLFAGLVTALTPAISFYAQTARSYALVFACVAGATLVLIRALDAEAAGAGEAASRLVRRWWLLYAALVALGGYLNEMSLLVLGAHGITVLLARPGRPVIRRWLSYAIGGAVVVTPLLGLSVLQHAAVSWIGRPGLASLRTLFRDYFGATTIVGVLLAACAVVAVLPRRARRQGKDGGVAAHGEASAAPELPWWRSGGLSLPSVAAPLLIMPAFILLAESTVLPPLYVDRYVLYGEAGAALLAGAGIYRIGQWLAAAPSRRMLIWVPGVALCICALVLQLGPQHRARMPGSRAYDFGGPSRYLAGHARSGDGVLFFDTLFRKAELGYPSDFTKVTDFGMALSPMQVGNFRGTDKSFAATEPLMLQYQRIWVIGMQPSPNLPTVLLRQQSGVLQQDFTRIISRHYRGIWVTLWQRR